MTQACKALKALKKYDSYTTLERILNVMLHQRWSCPCECRFVRQTVSAALKVTDNVK